MSQFSYSIGDESGSLFLADNNSAHQANASMNSGTSAPSTTYGNLLWADTTNTLAKKRNNANAAWKTFADLDFTHWLLDDGTVGAPSYSWNTDSDNGLYRIGANNWGGAAGGAKVFDVSTAGFGVTGTLTASGVVSTTATSGNMFLSSSATTGNAYGRISNTSGSFYWGVESSAGGSIITGAAAYASVISGGSLYISANSGAGFQFALTSSGAFSYNGINPSSGGASSANIFSASAGGSTTTLYIGNQSINTTSDVRLKTNIRDTERDALVIVNALRVVDHGWNDPSDQCENNRNSRGEWMGLIAQEAVAHVPWLVNKPLADEDEEGRPNYWNMDFGYGVPLLVKAMQQLSARVVALEAA